MSDSKKQKSSSNSEEIDLIIFFNLIEKAFSRLIRFFVSIIKAIFVYIIYAIKAVLEHWKLIFTVLAIAFVLGYFLEKRHTQVYKSSMLVRSYFESKYQLISNVDYYNSLIKNKDYKTIKEIFSITDDQVRAIKGFGIVPGPETENDKIIEYEKFLKRIDSNRIDEISFKQFIDNRTIYSGNLFLLTAEAYKKNVFLALEKGLNSSFSNKYSQKKKSTRDSLIAIQKENIKDNLREMDSLQQVYIGVLKSESDSDNSSISIGGETISLPKEKTSTREYELLNKQIELRNRLQKLDEEKVEDDVFFDVISSFQKIGNPVNRLVDKHHLTFPIFAFTFMVFLFLLKKVIIYAKNYED